MPVDLYGGPTHKPCHLLFSGPTHRLCQVLFSWPMWAFTKAKVKLHMGFHVYTVYMLLNYVHFGHVYLCLVVAHQILKFVDMLMHGANDAQGVAPQVSPCLPPFPRPSPSAYKQPWSVCILCFFCFLLIFFCLACH